MNGEYLSYYPQFESNQVLTNTHLNELRQYLDEQIRLTRSQLVGVGVACGLTFEIKEPTSEEQKLPELKYKFGIRLYAGFGISSEGYIVGLEGERALAEQANPDDPTPGDANDDYRSTRYSDYIKYRTYTDPKTDLYWYKGTEAAPKQITILELLTRRDAEELILEGVKESELHDLTRAKCEDQVLVLYLEQNDVALKTCVGKDCDNKGSKRYITPRVLLIKRGEKAGINGQKKPAEIVMTGLDGLLIRKPYPRPLRVPRLVMGLEAKGHDLQHIHTYRPIGEGYLQVADEWKRRLARAIRDARATYGPFLGLTDHDLDQIEALADMQFTDTHAQYALDFLKDICRGLNEFILLAYQLKRDCYNEGYIFPRHLMLGTVLHDAEFNRFYYDKYRNYFIRFGLTDEQDRKLRIAQLLFERLLVQIKHFRSVPPNVIGEDGLAIIVPSHEDEYPVGKGSIPDYYDFPRSSPANPADLVLAWDPERTLDGLHDEVLSFSPKAYSTRDYVLDPLAHDLDDYPFYKIQSFIGDDVNDAVRSVRKTMVKRNLAFEVVAVRLGNGLTPKELTENAALDGSMSMLESQYQSLRTLLHALLAELRATILATDFARLQRDIALPMDLKLRFIDQTPVLDNLLIALSSPTLLDFVIEDGIPSLVRGAVPPKANDSPAGLFSYMYQQLRTLAQYLVLLHDHKIALLLRQRVDACDKTHTVEDLRKMEQALELLRAFLADKQWAQLESVVVLAKERLERLKKDSSLLFHNFAALHPGIEHLGGTYKGGTYVLVYEERNRRQIIIHDGGGGLVEIKDGPTGEVKTPDFPVKIDGPIGEVKTPDFPVKIDGPIGEVKTPDFPAKDGLIGEVKPQDFPAKDGPGGEVKPQDLPDKGDFTIKTEGLFFKAEFDMDAVWSDDVSGAELIMDAAFDSRLENTALKTFLVNQLKAITTNALSEKELSTLQASTVELLFETYLKIRKARGGTFSPEKVKATYIAAIEKGRTKATVKLKALIDDYLAFLGGGALEAKTELPDLRTIEGEGTEKEVIKPVFEGEEKVLEVKLGEDSPTKEEPLDKEISAVGKEELMALRDLLVEVIIKMDGGALGREIEILEKATVQELWPTYLEITAKAREAKFDVAAINELTGRYLDRLDAVSNTTLLKRGIQQDTWTRYKASIRTGTPFTDGTEPSGDDAFRTFLLAQIQDFGHVGVSATDIQRLAKAEVEAFWNTYVNIYAHAVGERYLDLDIQRNLTHAFVEQLKAADQDEAERKDYDKLLEEYISFLRKFLASISPTALQDMGDVTELLELLRRVLEETYTHPDIETIFREKPDFPRVPAPKEPAQFWPNFEQAFKAENKKVTAEQLLKFRELYLDSLRKASKEGFGIGKDTGAQLENYIYYLGAAGEADNPYMRQGLLEILEEMGKEVVEGKAVAKLRDQSVTALWPQFLRAFLRAKGQPITDEAAAAVQNVYTDRLFAADREGLRKHGIEAMWFAYAAELVAKPPVGEDKVGMLIGFVVDVLADAFPDALKKQGYAALRSLGIADVLPAWLAQLKDKEGNPLDFKEKEKARERAIGALVEAKLPEHFPKGSRELWEAYLATLGDFKPVPVTFCPVVADFSLPYRVQTKPYALVDEAPRVSLPPLIVNGDSAVVEPGTSVDIRILANDDHASGGAAENDTALQVRIVDVMHPSGALGGKAYLIGDPKSALAVKPATILRYEAYFGTPLEGGEIAEITYEVLNTQTKQAALGKVLILTRMPLGLISDPCCCCKDYSFLVTQGETLHIDAPFQDFEDKKPFALAFVDMDGRDVTVLEGDEFRATVTKNTIEFISNAMFEGTVRLPYRVRYEGGRAYCEGMITVLVVCECAALPCEVGMGMETEKKKAVFGLLTEEQIKDGMQVRINKADKPVKEATNPVDLIAFAKVVSDAEGNPLVGIEVQSNPTTPGVARLEFYKGRMDASEFVITGKCTVVVTIAKALCSSEATATAGTKTKIESPLSADESAAGMSLHFAQFDKPTSTHIPAPKGLLEIVLAHSGQVKGVLDTFFVITDPQFVGDVTFDFFKGKLTGEIFVVDSRCTMTIHVEPAEACVKTYSTPENSSIMIEDLLTTEEIKAGYRIQFEVEGNGWPYLPAYPTGAQYVYLLANGTGEPNTAFMLQPILGYNGKIRWPYQKYFIGGGEAVQPESCEVVVDVTEAVDCVVPVTAAPGEVVLYKDSLPLDEIEKGTELRFFNGYGFDQYYVGGDPGVALLELTRNVEERLVYWRFQSPFGFEGKVTFRIAAGQFNGYNFMAKRICTVTIDVKEPEIKVEIFEVTEPATVQENTTINSIITLKDWNEGVDRLKFATEKGEPMDTVPIISGLSSLSLTYGGPYFTSFEGAVNLTIERGAPEQITIPLVKGKFGAKGFVVTAIGRLIVDVTRKNEIPTFVADRSVEIGNEVFITDILSEEDLKAGMIQLSFSDGAGNPTPNFYANGLSYISLVPGGISGEKNSALRLLVDQSASGPIVVPLIKGRGDAPNFEVLARGQMILTPKGRTVATYTYDTRFQSNPYYDPYEYSTAEVIELLNQVQGIVNDKEQMEYVRLGYYDGSLGSQYYNALQILRDRVIYGGGNPERRNLYLMMFATLVDTAIELQQRAGDLQYGTNMESVFFSIGGHLQSFMEYGYFNPPQLGDPIGDMLRNRTIDPQAAYLTEMVSRWTKF